MSQVIDTKGHNGRLSTPSIIAQGAGSPLRHLSPGRTVWHAASMDEVAIQAAGIQEASREVITIAFWL